jgi:hypothetical protein
MSSAAGLQQKGPSIVSAARAYRRCDEVAQFALGIALLGFCSAAFAGDMDAVGYAIMAVYIVIGVLIAGCVVALWACRYIANVRMRALARLLILVAVFTPVPLPVQPGQIQIVPAFFAAMNRSPYVPHEGILSHPVALAYGITLLLGLLVTMLWMHVGARYGSLRLANDAQRNKVSSSANNAAPPTKSPQ